MCSNIYRFVKTKWWACHKSPKLIFKKQTNKPFFSCCCKWYLLITFHHTIKWAGGSTWIKTAKRKKGHSSCGNVDWRFSHKSFFSQRSNSVLVLLPDSLLLWWYQVPKSLLIYPHIQTHTEPHTHGYTHSDSVSSLQSVLHNGCMFPSRDPKCLQEKEGR